MKPFVFNASVLGLTTTSILFATWYDYEWKDFRTYFNNLRNDSWYVVHGMMGSALAGLCGEFLIKND